MTPSSPHPVPPPTESRFDAASSGDPIRAGRGLIGAVELCGLVAIQLLLLWGFWNCLDLHPADEAIYFASGRSLIQGNPACLDLAWSPLYSVCYGLLAAILPDGWPLPVDIMFVLVCLGNTLVVWWALRAVFPTTLAFLIAAWWGASPVLLSSDLQAVPPVPARPMSNAFSLILSAAAIGLAVRNRCWAACAVLALLFLARAEAAGVLAVCGVLLLLASRAHEHRRLRAPGWFALVCGVLLCVVVATHSGLRQRTWFNFQQNYALVLEKRGADLSGEPGVAAMDHSVDWTHAAFPNANSLASAAFENPVELAAHAWFNFADLPRQVFETCLSSFAHLPWVRWPALALLAVLALVAVSRSRKRSDSMFAVVPLPAWAVSLAHLAVLVPLVLIQSRGRMLLPLVPLLLTAAACLALAGWRPVFARPVGVVARCLVPVVAVVLVAVGPRLFANELTTVRPTFRTSVAIVRDLVPDEPKRALGVFMEGVTRLAGKDRIVPLGFHPIRTDPERRFAPFARILADLRPDLVLVTPGLLQLGVQHEGLARELFSDRFTSHPVLPGFYLQVRSDSDLRVDSDAIGRFARAHGASPERAAARLEGSTTVLSLSRGGVLSFSLSVEPRYAGWHYLLVGTMSGTDPGVSLGSCHVSLNPDAYLEFLAGSPNTLIANSLGQLDASGKASAQLRLPAGSPPDWAGLRLHHAFIVFRRPKSAVAAASNSVAVSLTE